MKPTNHIKQLLVFAHRGEAKRFLKHIAWTSRKDVDGLYESDTLFLLISGEGRVNILVKLSAAVVLLKPDLIVNYGTCGALRETVRVGEIYPVRTAYAADGMRPRFKSYTTVIKEAEVDCISVGERVQDVETAGVLGHYAHIVDRELWSAGAVAQEFNIPLAAYKLVTDLADGCLPISDRDQISELLWKHFEESQSIAVPQTTDRRKDFPLPDGFYFTTSQNRRFQSLYRSFRLKTNGEDDQALAGFIADLDLPDTDSPKRKAAKLLDAMADYLSPFNAALRKKLGDKTAQLQKAGWEVRFDANMESEDIALKAVVTSEKKLGLLIKSLQELPYRQLSGLLRGHLDSGKDKTDV